MREAIELGLSRGRDATAIWQDLVAENGFDGGYQTVKRYVRKLRGNQPLQPRAVIVTGPGGGSQVDYGTGAMVRDPQTRKYRRTRNTSLILRMDKPFWGIGSSSAPEEKPPTGYPAPPSALTHKARSQDVNIEPGATAPVLSWLVLFTSPESLFASSWNPYSQLPGIPIHMPRNTHREISDYVDDKYKDASPAKVGDFLAKADCWIIAHALAKSGTVVTRETKVDKASQTPKVPNVCEKFEVPFIQTFDLLKLLKFKL